MEIYLKVLTISKAQNTGNHRETQHPTVQKALESFWKQAFGPIYTHELSSFYIIKFKLEKLYILFRVEFLHK